MITQTEHFFAPMEALPLPKRVVSEKELTACYG